MITIVKMTISISSNYYYSNSSTKDVNTIIIKIAKTDSTTILEVWLYLSTYYNPSMMVNQMRCTIDAIQAYAMLHRCYLEDMRCVREVI